MTAATPDGVALAERAPAKVNLTLHVLGRRADGYHDLASLVAFAGTGDRLTLRPGPRLSLTVAGPTAGLAGPDSDNLVLKAAQALAGRCEGLHLGAFALTKRLPVAAGLGGGSSDAAAALRLLARANGLSGDDPRLWDAARATGADVPVCLDPRARMMHGIGHEVGPALPFAPVFAVLANPRVAVPTPAVFRELGMRPGDVRPGAEDGAAGLAEGRNDLQAPAIGVAPVIAVVLQDLAALPGCKLVRMSGSGATCFGVFPDCRAAAQAARSLKRRRPAWWVAPTVLR